jgi:hypothetical protein
MNFTAYSESDSLPERRKALHQGCDDKIKKRVPARPEMGSGFGSFDSHALTTVLIVTELHLTVG